VWPGGSGDGDEEDKVSPTYRQCIDEDDLGSFALTPEQHNVVARLARGLSYAEVALELGISEDAVKSRVRRVVARLNAGNVREALSILSEWGLISRRRPPPKDSKR
jgi:DNA-binding CsgD family transcriptional regulator